ncbi:SpaH/EbpB family LPXTG-anchored major pilin [Gardnerella sp. DNF01192]|uniref:SpaH/EbpB family LPXTG-anchored major pilin n=1 Tax=Gardnerella sp. DNF01192 TaxID=2749064 RepID=UPI003BABAEB9
MKKFTNKFVAAVASLAMAGTLCVAGAVTMAGVAWAKGNNLISGGPSGPAPAPWGKGAPQKGTITILKCVKDKDAKTPSSPSSTTSATSTRGGGKHVPQVQSVSCKAGFKPLKDATFKLTKVVSVKEGSQYVDLDLKSFESWQKIAKLVTKLNDHTITDSGDNAEVKLDANSATQSTGENGIAKFGTKDAPIDLGLYKVEETSAPTGYGVSDLQSFYMTLPLPEYTTTGTGQDAKTTVSYEYNPTVKPKNKDLSTTIQKVYDKTKFASVKDKVPFTITAEVNIAKRDDRNLTANDLQGYKVFDDAPTAAFKTIDASVVKHVKINGTEVTNDNTNTYYNVETPIVNNSDDAKANDDASENQRGLAGKHTRILVTFTDKGIEKIAEEINKCKTAGDTIKVEVDLEFEINPDYQTYTAPADGQTAADTSKDQIINKSGFFPAHQKDASALPPIIPDNEHSQATIDFGYLDVHKYYMQDGKKTDLSGAEFRIFADEKKANACAKGLADPSKKVDGVKECKAASTIGTAAAGAQPGATTDVQTATTNDSGNFATAYKTRAGVPVYLVEVKAPKGYAISPVVHAVTVTKDTTTTEPFENFPLKGGDDGKSFWFNLPATGAYGVLIFAVVGMVLIVASVIMYVRNRKEEEQQQNA